MNNIKIVKKNNTIECFDGNKIIAAVFKSSNRVGVKLSDFDNNWIVERVKEAILETFTTKVDIKFIEVKTLHNIVEKVLSTNYPKVAQSYREYRNYKTDFASMLDEVYQKTKSIMYHGDRENANSDSSLVSTQQSLIRGELTKAFYDKFYMNIEERQACKDGFIYIHDKKDKMFTSNCCIADINNILKGGFESCNLWYNEPNSVLVACEVIADTIMMAAGQQFGGFSVRLDDVLPYYCEKSYNKYYEEGETLPQKFCEDADYVNMKVLKDWAIEKTIKELEQGIQAIEYKMNTIASSRGDFPFTTIAIGLDASFWGKEVSKAVLKVRREGQGKKGFKKPVIFPKLVFLYTKDLHGEGKPLEEVFNTAVECSSVSMYPDYVSLDAGYIGDVYKKWGVPIVPMGCRSYVSPYYPNGIIKPQNDEDIPIFVGRWNIGVISLNLVMIYLEAKDKKQDFYTLLDYYLELSRQHHIKTYNMLCKKKASINPLMFTQGGLYMGNLNPNDTIESIVKHATTSFGYTGLNELNIIYNGKTIVEDGEFPLEVLKYINSKVEQFKEEDNILHSVYATPGENLVGLQVKQIKDKYGDIARITNKPYLTNSFHCHVSEDITPIEKQDLEARFWDYSVGGRIQYVRYNYHNIDAIKTLVRRAMKMGFYEGVNMALSYCEECGYEQLDMNECPRCLSTNITKIDRNCGYLSYTKVKGKTRLNDTKYAEVLDRKSM